MKITKLLTTIFFMLLLVGCQNESSPTETSEEEQPSTTESIPSESSESIEMSIEEELSDDVLSEKEYLGDLNYADFNSAEEIIWNDIYSYGYPADNLSISYYDFTTGEEFHLNADTPAHAASTNKVGTAVLYTNLVNQGILSFDSHLPLNPAWIDEGAGDITANPSQPSYPVIELIFQSLFYSDNTAWNMLINNYYQMFGNFQVDLIALSGLAFDNSEIYNLNYATSRMLNEILYLVATDSQYQHIVDIMLEAQSGLFLKMYVDEGMAAKYGQYENGHHDTGIYYENGQPVYTIAVMSYDLGYIDYFLGDLNLHLKEFHEYQTAQMNSNPV